MIRRLIPTPSQRSHRVPKYISASNQRSLQPMAPSGNLSLSATYPQLPTPNTTVAQSASSPFRVQGPRPNTNRPNYALTLCQCCSLLAGRPTGSICVGGQHAPALGRRYRVLPQHARGPLRMDHGCSGRPVYHLDAKGRLKV